MSLEDNIRALERTPVLAEIGREPLRLLAFSAEQKNLSSNERLFERGAHADCAYTVVSGRIRLDNDNDMRVVGPGALIGEMALIVETTRPCDAFSDGPSRVLIVPRSLFRKMLEEYPHIADALRARLIQRVRGEFAELERIREDLDRLPGG